MSPLLRVAWYRFHVTFRRQLGGYLALIVFLGLIGGIALGSLIAARRTEASYPLYLSSTNPSDLVVQPTTSVSCTSPFVQSIGRLPHVRRVRCAFALEAETLNADRSINTILLTQVELIASLDGMFSTQDKVKIVSGRSADPKRTNEIVASPAAASLLHLRVGSHLLVGVDTSSEPPLGKPQRVLDLDVVGIGVFNTQIVQDDIDHGHTGFLLGTPSLAREYSRCCTDLTYDGLQLTGGSHDDVLVEREYAALVGKKFNLTSAQLQVYETSVIETEAERAIRPEAIALGVFGTIAFLAALIIATQMISRRLRDLASEGDVLWALGASPRAVDADGLVGLLAAIVIGSILAAAVGVALSPLAVFGPVRTLNSSLGFDLDWTVVGLGVAAFVIILWTTAATIAHRLAPHGRSVGDQHSEQASGVLQAALRAGLPPSLVIGLRFALQAGRGRSAVPVRSAIAGGVLAVSVAMGTLTFGTSLDTLASHPALYGWNFDSALYSTDGYGPIPSVVVDPLLAHDPEVASATGVYFGTLELDGEAVPAIAAPTDGAWTPALLTGHRIEKSDEIILGSATLSALHKRVGDSIVVTGEGLQLHLRIVGIGTLPTIGTPLGLHASISTGAVLSVAVLPPALLKVYGPFSGPNAIFVRFRHGVSTAAGNQTLLALTRRLTALARSPKLVAESQGISAGLTFEVLGQQRPAEIVNYRSMGTTPGILAAGLATGAVAALALTLIASVRRRRHELALLKTLGLTKRQLTLTIAAQATALAVLSLVVGTPLGIAAGRVLWLLFAHQLSAVAEPVVPTALIVIVAASTLVVANLVAALPGRLAARTPTAMLLRAE